MKILKLLVMVIVCAIFLLGAGYGLFQISKSRTFQFFGGLTSRVDTQQKVVALTFDDAPTEYTPFVLKILQGKQVNGTFFAIGSQLEKYPEIGKDIVRQGHEIGNHSYTHSRFLLKSQAFIDDEIQKTNKLIRQTGYKGEITFRPPNGKKLFGLPWYLHQHNIKSITWDVEPDTYIKGNIKPGESKSDFIVRYTLEHVQPGSIILLHPFCKSCEADRNAISKIIDGLRAKGYKFVTVSQLLTYSAK